MGFQQNPIAQLLGMILILGMIVCLGSAIAYFRFWKLHRWRTVLPIIVWALTVLLPGLLARKARDLYFEFKISDLEEEIEVYRATGSYPETGWSGVGNLKVHTLVNERGDTVITYWWGEGFPVRHSALLYVNSPESVFVDGGPLALQEAGWGRSYEIQENWYVASN